MEEGGKVVEVLVSGFWESLNQGESIGEDDHLGVNGLRVVREGIGFCCPHRFCFSPVVGRVFPSQESVANGPSIVQFDDFINVWAALRGKNSFNDSYIFSSFTSLEYLF